VGLLFDLDPDVLQVAEFGFRDLHTALAKECTLVFPPAPGAPPGWAGGSAGAAAWGRAEAPAAAPPTAPVRLLVAWKPKDFWVKPAPGVTLPAGAIQTKGLLADLAAVTAADHLLVQSALADRLRLKFARDGDPVDPNNIVPDVFFVLNWKRVG
jgi:hypothetical protein